MTLNADTVITWCRAPH